MKALPIELAGWIHSEKYPLKPGGLDTDGVTIGQCIPAFFDAYCKIFHPFQVTHGPPGNLEFQNPLGQISDGTTSSIGQEREEWLEEYNSKHWDFVSWKNMAEKYGFIFHNQLSPTTFVKKFKEIGIQMNSAFPSEGYLPRPLLLELLQILKLYTDSNEIAIYQAVPDSILDFSNPDELVKCTFEEVRDYFGDEFRGYLYAIDRSWIVYTNTDLTFTIVGGEKTLIDAVTQCKLEAIECTATTRVDNESDNINWR